MVHVTQMMSVDTGLNVEREIAQNFLNRIVVMSQMVTIPHTYYIMIENSSKLKEFSCHVFSHSKKIY